MRVPAKAFIVTLVSLVTLAFGIAPAAALPQGEPLYEEAAAVQPAAPAAQTFSTEANSLETKSLDTLLQQRWEAENEYLQLRAQLNDEAERDVRRREALANLNLLDED